MSSYAWFCLTNSPENLQIIKFTIMLNKEKKQIFGISGRKITYEFTDY